MRILKLLFLSAWLTGAYAAPALYNDPGASIEERKALSCELSLSKTSHEEDLIQHVRFAIDRGERLESPLPPSAFEIPGMSSAKGRCFLNALCSKPGTRYLEIGCWKGSTFIAALYQNQKNVVYAAGIDDWSQFQGPYRAFATYCRRYLPETDFEFYSHDCFSIDPTKFIKEPINVYFYDGGHGKDDQANAFLFFDSVLDSVFITVVDDWNWKAVREGTFEAFSALNYTVLYEVSLPSAAKGEDVSQWWNGCYAAVIRKNQ